MCIYIYVCVCVCECYPVIKKNEMLPFTEAWMNLEGILLSEISQTEKDKHHVISHVKSKKRKSQAHRRDQTCERKSKDADQKVKFPSYKY